jgi:hypothetical protein
MGLFVQHIMGRIVDFKKGICYDLLVLKVQTVAWQIESPTFAR